MLATGRGGSGAAGRAKPVCMPIGIGAGAGIGALGGAVCTGLDCVTTAGPRMGICAGAPGGAVTTLPLV